MDDLNFLKHLLICFLSLIVMNSTSFGVVAQSNEPFYISPETLCNLTTYANTCQDTLYPLLNQNETNDSVYLYNLSIQAAKRELLIAFTNFDENGTVHQRFDNVTYEKVRLALQSCHQVLGLGLYYLDWAIPTNGTSDLTSLESREDFRTWISSVASLLETCKDEFDDTPDESDDTPDGVKEVVVELLDNSTKTISNCLDIMYQIIIHSNETRSLDMDKTISYKSTSNWPPTWLSDKDKMLLEDSGVEDRPDVVVAKDGSGNYTTINEALSVVPPKSDKRFVIYVKEGVYLERVLVEKEKWNVVMYGDGMNRTVVSADCNKGQGIPTFQTATLSVFGKGFIAKYMGFQNTAGPNGHQAVAVLSTATRSIFYRCRIDGYQDTLYAHSMYQFYRECKISGTIDFIFGHSAVVIQSSDIIVKRPGTGQHCIITAQGKAHYGFDSAISIQNCQIYASEDLTGVETYLGRPWKNYSTTVFMESSMGDFINPKGWSNWVKGVIPPNTIYYAEYMNNGTGANTDNRVNWEGVRRNISPVEASNFTVRSLLRGFEWIPETGVPFQSDL